MRFLKNHKVRIVAMFLLAAIVMTFVQPIQAQAATNAKIHFLALPGNTLSVLVECNGQFGMIDSGEDNDDPDGSDPRYPVVEAAVGFEKEVLAYLKSVGVTKDNFVFYIGTHPHSDHIGSADEVIREFEPERVYLQEYKNSYVTNPAAWWDNLYIYDRMLAAAEDVGAQIIQNINSSNAVFTLGNGMKISIKNYGSDYKTKPVPDANYFSLGVLVEANGKSVFVGADINNFDGDENALLRELGHVDVLQLGHHGYYGSNSYNYVTGLTPKMLIIPGTYSGVSSNALPNDKALIDTLMEMGKKGVPVYATGWYAGELGAIVINFDASLSTNIPANDVKTVRTTNVIPRMEIVYKNGIPSSATAVGQWFQDGGRWWYSHADGSYPVSSWEKIDGSWYYFDAEGWMVTGWLQWEGSWYYLNPTTGAMTTGWKTVSGQTYYFDGEGIMKTGWQQIGSAWYYFNGEGAMVTGWIKLNNVWYYLNPGNGVLATGWKQIDGATYYFNADGAMQANTMVDGKYLGSDGVWDPEFGVAKWVQDGGGWWYRHADGSYTKSDWEQIDGKWYYFDASGYRATGWIQLKGVWYYLTPSTGVMVTGWQTIDGATYYFSGDGAMVTNTTVDGKYLGKDGVYAPAGWVTEGERKWYRHADGSYTVNNWEQIDGKWYFFDAEGWMATGWIQWKNVWYYLNPSNGVMVTGWQTISGKTYYFDASGAMKTGWLQVSGKWYYLDASGARVTGWLQLGGTWYYLYPSTGVMATNTWVDGCYLNSSGAWVA